MAGRLVRPAPLIGVCVIGADQIVRARDVTSRIKLWGLKRALGWLAREAGIPQLRHSP